MSGRQAPCWKPMEHRVGSTVATPEADRARVVARVRAWGAREGWASDGLLDVDGVLIALGLADPPARALLAPVRAEPANGRSYRPPALCAGEGCDRVIAFWKRDLTDGLCPHKERDMCERCAKRARATPRVKRPPAPCAAGCGRVIVFYRADERRGVPDRLYRHGGHGLCTECAKRRRRAESAL